MTPKVIDLSHHNVIPQSLKETRAAGVLGLIHKCTEGTSYRDDKVAARYALAQDAGMLWGLYHFVRPGKIVEQADFFIRQAGTVSDENTLFCLDWEVPEVSASDALKFMQRVEELTGHHPVLYSGHVCKEQPDERLAGYRLWIAQYGSSCSLPKYFESYWLWQYTDKGEVPGVTPPTDLNHYDGSDDDLIAEWSGNPEAPIPQPGQLEVSVTVHVDAPPGVNVKVYVT